MGALGFGERGSSEDFIFKMGVGREVAILQGRKASFTVTVPRVFLFLLHKRIK